MILLHITKAYADAPTDRTIHVELPPEDGHNGAMCGLLRRTMNGTRDGAKNWGNFFAKVLTAELMYKFVQGKSSPCVFYWT